MVLLKVIALRDSGGMVPETFLQVFTIIIIDPHHHQHHHQYLSGQPLVGYYLLLFAGVVQVGS